MMMRPVNAAFKLAPKAFYGVCVASPANIFLCAVIDDLVAVTELGNVIVGRIFVSVNLRSRLDRGADLLNGVGSPDNIHNLRLNAAAPLHNTNYRRLAFRSASSLAGAFTANVGFVGLALASELNRLVGHELANLMAHAPSSLIGDPNLSLDFLCRHPILGIGHEHDGEEPRCQRRNGLVENRACRWVHLITAPSAFVGAAFIDRVKTIFLAAFSASPAVRPAGFKQKIKASAVVRELRLKI